jgi:ArsR family transcriptional regulator, arsenate/arsenite/antimonite-responsive transcriptional repressor
MSEIGTDIDDRQYVWDPRSVTVLPLIQQLTACCAPLASAVLDEQDAARLAGLLKVVADPTRLRLLSLIGSSTDGEVCVCDLTAPLGLSQPTVSHHLKVLTGAGLVQRDKRGVWAYYRVVPGALSGLAAVFSGPSETVPVSPGPAGSVVG